MLTKLISAENARNTTMCTLFWGNVATFAGTQESWHTACVLTWRILPAHWAFFRILWHVNHTLRTSRDADLSGKWNVFFSNSSAMMPALWNWPFRQYFLALLYSYRFLHLWTQIYWLVFFLLLNFIRRIDCFKEFSI